MNKRVSVYDYINGLDYTLLTIEYYSKLSIQIVKECGGNRKWGEGGGGGGVIPKYLLLFLQRELLASS